MRTPRPFQIAVVAFAMAVIAGCAASQPSRFYVLSALEPSGKENPRPCPDGRTVSLGVNPVDLPRYLDRPQIMTRVGDNELRLSELNVWAEPLKEGIRRVIAQNLSTLLCSEVVVYPRTGPRQTDYRLSADVLRLERTPAGQAVLEVQWSVLDEKTKKVLASRISRYAEPVRPDDYNALASAYSRILLSFSREAADTIRSSSTGDPQ
jgi:uncharacterized lipoprotein YmbA